MRKHYRLTTLLISMALALSAMATLPTGQWQNHLSYVDGQRLAISDNKVYCVASGSLFSYGKKDNALETYSKITGLNDVFINDIAYCELNETLVICYKNGNIDLMNADGVINIPDLYLKPIYGDKTINKVDIDGEIAYLSTAFGILKLDLSKNEISETYKLSNDAVNGVNGVATLDNEIYAATENGLYKADLDHPNLQDFSAWTLVTTIGDYNQPVRGVISFSNHIVTTQYNESDKYYYIKQQTSSTQWNQLYKSTVFSSFGANEDLLLVADGRNIKRFNAQFSQLSDISSYNYAELEYAMQNQIHVSHAIPIDDNSYYVADIYQGLVSYKTSTTTSHFQPKGPATNTIWDVCISQNVLRTVHGAMSYDYNNVWTPGAFSTLSDNKWNHVAKYNGGKSFYDLVGIITDPLDVDHFYISTFGYGILEYQNDEFILQYGENNSTLENAIPGSVNYTRTIGMAFDNDNNLWVNNSSALQQLHVKTTDGDWFGFESKLPKSYLRYSEILILDDNVKWIVTPYFGDGILVYDDKGTFDDTSDDEDSYFSIYASNNDGTSEKVSDKVNDLTLDNDGTIWVGSDNGVARYFDPTGIFDSNETPMASRINIPRNDGTGLSDYLLDGTTVNSIAVDGGNRKWLATSTTGVMLVSPDGQDVLHHFTKENSPLLSNNVRQVEINQETGEVYFATEAGLLSFQADATTGESDFSDLKVYPNPVREDFFGDITITGLVDETFVKITDVSGNLVKETESNGGTAVWDGKNFYGERVGTGVYLIFCSDQEGERSGMTKVLVIN